MKFYKPVQCHFTLRNKMYIRDRIPIWFDHIAHSRHNKSYGHLCHLAYVCMSNIWFVGFGLGYVWNIPLARLQHFRFTPRNPSKTWKLWCSSRTDNIELRITDISTHSSQKEFEAHIRCWVVYYAYGSPRLKGRSFLDHILHQ